MFDPNRTIELVKGALLDREATWQSYLPEASDWKKTATLLTGPLVVVSAVVAFVLGLLGGGSALFGGPTLSGLLLAIIWGAIAAAVVAYIFGAFASAFGGRGGFALGLAATTLAFVPGYVGRALSGLPFIGWLLSLGLAVYSLVLLWRIAPLYFEVPSEKRAAHYGVSLLASIVAFLVLSAVLGGGLLGGGQAFDQRPATSRGAPSAASDGMFGGLARQADLIAAAEEDRYDPPADGRLAERQVQEFIRVMARAEEASAAREERLKEIAERAEANQRVSLGDLTSVVAGITEVAGLNTAEIEVVKAGGGNWAEHQWVRESLRTAWLLKDGDGAVAANYALYRKYEGELAEHIVR